MTAGAVRPSSVALGRDAAAAGMPAAGMGAPNDGVAAPLGRAFVRSSSSTFVSSSAKTCVASSAKTCVASSSSSQSTSTFDFTGARGEGTGAAEAAGLAELGATGGKEPRFGGGGGAARDGVDGGGGKPAPDEGAPPGSVDGAVIPTSVRFDSFGRSEGG